MPRLYREAPLNAIWEGSSNVNCLDVLRAMAREPRTAQALFAEIEHVQGSDARLDAAYQRLQSELSDQTMYETRARHLVESMALVLQGALLIQHGHPAVAEAFCASRLAGQWGNTFGTLPAGIDFRAIIERASVHA